MVYTGAVGRVRFSLRNGIWVTKSCSLEGRRCAGVMSVSAGIVVLELCENCRGCERAEVAMKGSVSSVSTLSMHGELGAALPIRARSPPRKGTVNYGSRSASEVPAKLPTYTSVRRLAIETGSWDVQIPPFGVPDARK